MALAGLFSRRFHELGKILGRGAKNRPLEREKADRKFGGLSWNRGLRWTEAGLLGLSGLFSKLCRCGYPYLLLGGLATQRGEGETAHEQAHEEEAARATHPSSRKSFYLKPRQQWGWELMENIGSP